MGHVGLLVGSVPALALRDEIFRQLGGGELLEALPDRVIWIVLRNSWIVLFQGEDDAPAIDPPQVAHVRTVLQGEKM